MFDIKRHFFPPLKGKEVCLCWNLSHSWTCVYEHRLWYHQQWHVQKNELFSGDSLCQAVNLLKLNMTEHAVLGWNPESQASSYFLSEWSHAETEKIEFYPAMRQFWNLVLPWKLFILGLRLQVSVCFITKIPKEILLHAAYRISCLALILVAHC